MANDTLAKPLAPEERLDCLIHLARLAGTQTCQDFSTLADRELAATSLEDEDIVERKGYLCLGKLSDRIMDKLLHSRRH